MTTQGAVQVAPGLHVVDEFLGRDLETRALEFLDAVPSVRMEDSDRRNRFEFTRPIFDGEPLRGREEACAGSPVWLREATTGVQIPRVIDEIRALVNSHLSLALTTMCPEFQWSTLTSVYVDRYDPNGRFVAHTDRAIYGPIIVGVSVGPGVGTLTFENGLEGCHSARLTPRSMYVMSPPLRDDPWVHSFQLEVGRRYAISFRSPASETPLTS